jgi:hypothetical protein
MQPCSAESSSRPVHFRPLPVSAEREHAERRTLNAFSCQPLRIKLVFY